MRVAPATAASFAVLTLVASAYAGHELTYYPSFYPQEITVEAVDPARAAERLEKNDLHAYLGVRPEFSAAIPKHLEPVESLDGFLVLDFDPTTQAFADRDSRCAVGRAVVADLNRELEGVVLIPYPVTPFHPDYLHHLDRVEAAKQALSTEEGAPSDLKVETQGARAEALVGARWPTQGQRWDVRLEWVPLSTLMKTPSLPLGAHSSPPWWKQGWYQAYQLFFPMMDDAALKKNAEVVYQRLTGGEYENLTQRINLERRLVAGLISECRRMVAGYTLRREYYSADPSGGIENVAYDGQSGLNSAVFMRTAKLKDFPWNGWLNLGTAKGSKAAWNPIAGFNDPAGRLIWSALGDPALLAMPYNAGFISNRVSAEVEHADGNNAPVFKVPSAALSFRPGSGEFLMVGADKTSSAKVTYRINASLNQDGTKSQVSDLLYAYAFIFRWSEMSNADDRTFDPDVESATRLVRERLVGVKVVEVESKTEQLAPDIQYTRETPIVEVYLNHRRGDPLAIAAIAPPWSTVPWHLVVLMEEAVKRGLAAFSASEANRLGTPWLDLARDQGLQRKLRALIEEFEKQGYRPDELAVSVSKEEASARWRALGDFAKAHDHLLVTNGPFRLKSGTDDKAVLEVVRELTYPWGVGAFDGYSYPARAMITSAKRQGETIILAVDVEKTVKAQRRYSTVREPFTKKATRGMFRIRADAPYLLLSASGEVIRTGEAKHVADGRFEVELPEDLTAGRYTLLAAVFPDGNTLRPGVTALAFEVGA